MAIKSRGGKVGVGAARRFTGLSKLVQALLRGSLLCGFDTSQLISTNTLKTWDEDLPTYIITKMDEGA